MKLHTRACDPVIKGSAEKIDSPPTRRACTDGDVPIPTSPRKVLLPLTDCDPWLVMMAVFAPASSNVYVRAAASDGHVSVKSVPEPYRKASCDDSRSDRSCPLASMSLPEMSPVAVIVAAVTELDDAKLPAETAPVTVALLAVIAPVVAMLPAETAPVVVRVAEVTAPLDATLDAEMLDAVTAPVATLPEVATPLTVILAPEIAPVVVRVAPVIAPLEETLAAETAPVAVTSSTPRSPLATMSTTLRVPLTVTSSTATKS